MLHTPRRLRHAEQVAALKPKTKTIAQGSICPNIKASLQREDGSRIDRALNRQCRPSFGPVAQAYARHPYANTGFGAAFLIGVVAWWYASSNTPARPEQQAGVSGTE